MNTTPQQSSDENQAEGGTVPPQLTKCEQERDEYLAGWQRARADYENLLKRLAMEKIAVGTAAVENAVKNFLPIFDLLERALKQIPSDLDGQPWADGLKHIFREWEMCLQRIGVERIKTIGEMFDPVMHEAIAERLDETAPVGTVLEETESGWKKGDVVLRPAKVIVASDMLRE